MAREIFISYSRWNLEAVKAIKLEIERVTGAKCWMDLNAIESGSAQFTQDIVIGIRECRVFLFMLSKDSQNSKFALRELNLASKKAEEDKQKHVIIVNIDGCQMCDEFYLLYGLTDTIAWANQPQKEKLLTDLKRWLGVKEDDEVEDKAKAEEQAERKGLEELERIKLVPIIKYGKYGFADESGKLVIPCQWEYAWPFSEGLALVKNEQWKWGYIDKTGTVVIPCQWKHAGNFSEGLALVRSEQGNKGFIDKAGKLVIPCQWKQAMDFSNGLALVKNEQGKWGFIDKTGNVVIPCQWERAWFFSNGLALVQNEQGKWGYIDIMGKVVIPCQWKDAEDFYFGFARVRDNNGIWRKIDRTGKVVG